MTKFFCSGVLAVMKEVVAEQGKDYVYPPALGDGECYYREKGQPECLVGRILRRMVPDFTPVEKLSLWDQRAELTALGFDPVALLCLQMAQSMQDRGHTWGSAMEAAGCVPEVIRAWRGLD